jgi:hypothetical protein
LIQSLAVSNLLYGSVIFSCLGPSRMSLTGGSLVFIRAEQLMRKMLRWALRSSTKDIRNSFLYVVSNSTNLQLLG